MDVGTGKLAKVVLRTAGGLEQIYFTGNTTGLKNVSKLATSLGEERILLLLFHTCFGIGNVSLPIKTCDPDVASFSVEGLNQNHFSYLLCGYFSLLVIALMCFLVSK